MSGAHYPSSAELAALRWAFHEAMPEHTPATCPIDGPRDRQRMPTGRAWPHEMKGMSGIGLSGGAFMPDENGDTWYSIVRRETARLRSEQFAADSQTAAANATPQEAQTWFEAVETFTPHPRRAYTVRTRPDGTAYIEWLPRARCGHPWTGPQMAAWQEHQATHR